MQSENQTSPTPDYDFIFKSDQKKPAKKIGLPTPNLPKPALYAIFGAVVLTILIIFWALLFGNKVSNTDRIVGIIGRANEIARISDVVGQATQDPSTQNLAATTKTALSSDSARLTSYLAGYKIKIQPAKLKLYTNPNTDAQVQTAQQNNNLPAYYQSYLKISLTDYTSAISTLYKTASVKYKPILLDAFNSAKVLLASPQVANSS